MNYLQRILTSTRTMHVHVATHEWLQPKTNFHRIVRMYYVVIRKVGQVVLCSTMYTETSTGQHQGDAVLHRKQAHRTSRWRGLKSPDSCIPPSHLRCCTKNRSIWACYLRSYWETDHDFFKNDKVSTPDHFLKIQWSKCKQVNIEQDVG